MNRNMRVTMLMNNFTIKASHQSYTYITHVPRGDISLMLQVCTAGSIKGF